jgi:hypothetical protein
VLPSARRDTPPCWHPPLRVCRARARTCSPRRPRPNARLPNASRIPNARAPRRLVTRAAPYAPRSVRQSAAGSPERAPAEAARVRRARVKASPRPVAVKARLFSPTYKTAAAGFSPCTRRRRRVGARRRYTLSTVDFAVSSAPNPCLPTPPKSCRAAPLLPRPRARRRQAPGGHRPAVPRSTHAGSPYPPTEPANRTLVGPRPFPRPAPAKPATSSPEFAPPTPATAPRGDIAR